MPKKIYSEWIIGDKKRLAEAAGISPQYLNDIIHARYGASKDTAINLETAATELGIPLDRFDFLYPLESSSPLIESD